MGSGQSVLRAEIDKPANCEDLTTEEEVMSELIRLRKLVRDHRKILKKAAQIAEKEQSPVSDEPMTSSRLTARLPKGDRARIPSNGGAMCLVPTGGASSPSRSRPANFAKFDNLQAKAFKLDKSPELRDYLSNEFNRFQNSDDDQRLSWDSFWRFTCYLDLDLTDEDIAALRQKADVNQDGFVDWFEVEAVFTPLLVRI
jgi:hypothetical protein